MSAIPGEIAILIGGYEAERIACETEVSIVSAYRWMNGSALPRRAHIPGIAKATGIAESRLREALSKDLFARRESRRVTA